MEDSVLAIDFGTSYTVCCFERSGNCEFCSINNGQHAVPSIVAFEPGINYGIDSGGGIYLRHLKTLIGETLGSLEKSGIDLNSFGMPLVEVDGTIGVEAKGTFHSVPDLITGFIKSMKEEGEMQAGRSFKNIIITVPARFTQRQRSIYKSAVEKAGLSVIKLINEPTAAVFEFLSKYNNIKDSTVLVYDLGGGTFDCSLVQVEGAKTISVLFSDGSSNIGSEMFDESVLNYIIEEIKKNGLECVSRDKRRRKWSEILQRIKEAKETIANRTLDIDVEGIISDHTEFQVRITESILYKILESTINETLEIVKRMLTNMNMTESSIDYVALIGGGSLLPIVKQRVCAYFHESRVIESANPKEIVASGALRSYHQNDIIFKSVTYYNYSLRLYDGKCYTIIPRGTPIPMDKPRREKFVPQRSGQEKVETAFYQGLSDDSNENELVQKIEFDITRLGKSKAFYIELFVDESDMVTIKAYENEPNETMYTVTVRRP